MSWVRPSCLLILLSGLLASTGNLAAGQSLAEVQAEVRRATSTWPQGRPPGDPAELRSAIQALGKAATSFIATADRAAQTGSEAKERAALLDAYRAVSQPLEAVYEQTGGQLERLVQKVIAEDGDLEALYESPEYRQGQALGAEALYYLNWVRFYGARLHDGAQRKALLEKAASGFGSFLGGEQKTDLQRESLFGRGLCALELGDFDAAIDDLQAVADDPQNPAERRTKARLALLDSLVRNGRYADAVKVSAPLADSGDPRALFLRARALLELARKGAPNDADRQRKEAVALLERVRRAGAAWEDRAQQLLLASADDPAALAREATSPRARLELAKLIMQKKQFPEAVRVLEELGKTARSLPPNLEAERNYLLGIALFQQGAWEAAARALDQAAEVRSPEDAAEAAYLRFKAREKLAAEKPGLADDPAYEAAIRNYVERFPQHRFAYEAFFRLGELLQRRQECQEALPYFARVAGDAEFALRARFATLQCQVSLLGTRARPDDASLGALGEQIRELVQSLGDAEQKRLVERTALANMRGKLAVLQAAWQSWQPTPDWTSIAQPLDRFEQRYPQLADLFAPAARLRLLALVELGQFGRAEQEAAEHGEALARFYDAKEVEALAVRFIRAGTARRNQGEAGADVAAQRVALQLYQGLATAGKLRESGELALARLYETTGNLERAEQLYRKALNDKPASLPLLRQLARLLEARGETREAVELWKRYAEGARPGDGPWYEGQYQLARLDKELGSPRAACQRLEGMKAAMPGLSDRELRSRLEQLYNEVCR